ncbi:MAG: MBL fold metallo-hydrolase [Bacillota bacterium]
MYELISFGKKTHYIDCPAKIGIYNIDDENVCLIDSGNSKDTAKKVLKIVMEQGWNIKTIINTHGHADHVGGNAYLQEETGCEILCRGIDHALTTHTIVNSSYLCGSNSPKIARGKFFYAQPADVKPLTCENLPEGLQMLACDGHSFSQTMFKTPDNAWFVADAIAGEETINKYGIVFVQNVEKYLDSLEMLKTIEGEYFIPSHVAPSSDISALVEFNIQKTYQVIDDILSFCAQKITFEHLIKALFDKYNLKLDFSQNMLIGSTVKSYLTYLLDNEKIDVVFQDNMQYWVAKN